VVVAALCGACNAILGNDEGVLVGSGGSGGAAGSSTAGDGSGASPNVGGSASGGSAGSGAGGTTGGTGGSEAGGGEAGMETGGSAQAGTAGSSGAAGSGGAAGCEEGQGQCESGLPEQCQGGQWEPQAACDVAPDLFCYEGLCLPCSPGTFKCDGNTPQQCSEVGEWENKTPCVNPNPICNGQTGTCSNISLVGGFSAPGLSSAAQVRVRGQFLLMPRVCDGGSTVCIRGGFLP
jgi:hypothetical protein